MKIENLTRDLDTAAQKQVQGGTALTGQVVPTNVQGNALEQKFNIGSCAPAAIGNSAEQSNYSSQSTLEPVGSLFVTPTWCAD